MVSARFIAGVFVALCAGIVLNIGSLVQKRAVNVLLKNKLKNLQKLEGSAFNKDNVHISVKELATDKLWLFGFLMQAILGAVLFIVAQSMIGPTLTPVLGSVGLVVLVFASCFLQEKLSWYEYIGLLILIGAVVLLGFTKMIIAIDTTDFLETKFLIRTAVYTGGCIAMCVFCKVWSWRKDRFEGLALAVLAGLLVAIQNFWISPATALGIVLIRGAHSEHKDPTFENHHLGWIIGYLILSVIMVIISNLQTVYERQLAFKVGNAAVVIPVSHIPSHLSGVVIYAYVWMLPEPTKFSLAFMCFGVFFLLFSSFIFGKRGAMLEKKLDSMDLEEIQPLTAPIINAAEEEEEGLTRSPRSPPDSPQSPDRISRYA